MNTRSPNPHRRQFITTSAWGAGALIAAPFLITSSKLSAADTATTKPDKDGWINLFDGKTLKGWHKNPRKIGHGTGGAWKAQDGVITGEQDPPGSGNGGILLTDQKFSDFEVMIDMKPDWGVCSGFFLRGHEQGKCIQMMVDYHERGNVGHLYGEGTGGFNTRTFDIDGVYKDKKLVGLKTSKHKAAKDVGLEHSCTPEQWLKVWKVNDWNTAKVRCVGKYPTITTWINGLKVNVFNGETSNVGKYDKEKVQKTLGGEGSIAVQVHGGKSWPKGSKCSWKNIKIRKL